MQVVGPAPTGSLNLVDIDSVQMLWILRRMRDEGIYLDGQKNEGTSKNYFLEQLHLLLLQIQFYRQLRTIRK